MKNYGKLEDIEELGSGIVTGQCQSMNSLPLTAFKLLIALEQASPVIGSGIQEFSHWIWNLGILDLEFWNSDWEEQ